MRNRSNTLNRIDYILALALAGFTLLFYCLTLTPSLSYRSPDGNELATIPYLLGLAHMPGYPLYTWLGKAFTLLPFGDVGHRMNLMSAVLGALGVGGLYLIISMVLQPTITSNTSRRTGALLAALMFAFSPTFWSQALIAEVYVPNIALVALTMLTLLRWEHTQRDRDFFVFTLTFGFSLGTHISNLGFAPAFIVFILLTDRSVLKRPTWWLAALAGFGLGLAQFVWLPLKANMLNDRFMVKYAPTTLLGIYNYTLGAFPQLKFAFSLGKIPDRIVIYLYLLGQQFGWFSLLLGVIGLVAMLLRRPNYYFLMVGMYLLHVWFFIQYRAFDLEVFFLPAHFLWSIFLAFSFVELLSWIEAFMRRLSNGVLPDTGRRVLAAMMVILGIVPLAKNLATIDRSDDVAINDFFANVWELLPPDSALITQGGVFGYDAFYWQMVYDTRSDVLLPTLPTPNPIPADIQGRVLFSTTPVLSQNAMRGPGGIPPDLIPSDVWQVPVLSGELSSLGELGRRRLVLYLLSDQAPDLVVDEATPSIMLNADIGGLALIGADLDPKSVESGGRMHLTLYWKNERPARYQATTTLDNHPLETHEIGFGNLQRYQAEIGPVLGRVVVEEYWLVIPSTTPTGTHVFRVQVGEDDIGIEIGVIEVVDREETMERWLRIAG